MKVLEFNGKPVKGLGVEEQFHGMSEEDLKRPGAAFLVWLTRTASSRSQKMHQMASALGVTYGYLIQLKKGIRETPRISADVVQAAARYLGCPPIFVKMAAGQVTAQDFYVPKDKMENDVNTAIAYMAGDPNYLYMLPPDLDKLPQDVKAALVLLYQDATGKNLLSSKHDWPRIAGMIREMLEVELAPRIVSSRKASK
ncbi:helix-turn-helix domain-containing protein [Thiobacillus denitrificans]|nr:helix-turn-helix transcriptional regulator [Thiobacillus denitrificans]